MKLPRENLQASIEFTKRLKMLQGKIQAILGGSPSLAKITLDFTKMPELDALEQKILKQNIDNRINRGDIKIKWN